ncbi:MAG: bifunctional 4-hydroxy-2-oxoglutarate aldolase/2-dehydro-3-deoxy-phosphogluconate aldolase [Acidobacteriota bacterium]|nr:bifunctional 4-hydroxy-2-oxoglutarate aldolase/2-dehydro-3-deoxy-phosphogluconate aldolase [Acidobacteriota bacterium]
MDPSKFVSLLGETKATAILRTSIAEAAGPAMDAAIRGGFRIVEFTLNTPGALDRIEEFAARPGVVVGAGTVLTVEDARDAVERGASFVVSPVVDADVIGAARDLGVAAVPGTHTPTEMLAAYRAGAPLQKLFPAPGIGPDYVRACLGPMPFLRIVPTSGVDAANAAAWLRAGAWAVGFVASLFAPDDLRDGNFDAIESRARVLLGSVG